nr:MAG TPA: hypothetical protein [Bacteriophage sp.]
MPLPLAIILFYTATNFYQEANFILYSPENIL